MWMLPVAKAINPTWCVLWPVTEPTISTNSPLGILPKNAFWSWSFQKAVYRSCTSRLLFQVQNMSFRNSSMLSFCFRFPLFFGFSCSVFFSFVGHLLGFKIIGLDGRKCRQVVEQDFHRNFRVNFSCFFCLFSPASLTKSCSFWYGLKDLFTLHK